MREIKFSGVIMIPDQIVRHDAGTAMVLWECTADGHKSSASKGDFDTSTLKVQEVMILGGAEATKTEERIRKEADARDQAIIKAEAKAKAKGGTVTNIDRDE